MLKQLLLKSFVIKRISKKRCLKRNRPDWTPIIEKDKTAWGDALKKEKKKKVLIATSVGAYLPGTIIESLLSVALTLRDTEVHVLLCDFPLPACFFCNIQVTISTNELLHCEISKKLCTFCRQNGNQVFEQLGLPIHWYSQYINRIEEIEHTAEKLFSTIPLDQFGDFSYNGLPIGQHAMAGAFRFFAIGDIQFEKHGPDVLLKFFKSSFIIASMMENLLKKNSFDCVVVHHGIYVPMGIIGEVCRKNNVRIVNWNPAYRKHCFIFSHNNSYHFTLMNESDEYWKTLPWTPGMENKIMEYLKSRRCGTFDWIWFHENPTEDITSIEKKIGIDFSKPVIGMLTNVIWDAQLHFNESIFSNMVNWVIETIRYFANRPDLQLLIRVHPAEIRGTLKSRQLLIPEIKKHFNKLPPNIFIIPPESNSSTYAAMEKCNSVIIYGTKTGIELASLGIPIIVGGEAWVRNKGITLDASSPEEYFNYLDRLPFKDPMDQDTIHTARKYAYHFFLRRMIPIHSLTVRKGWPPYLLSVTSLDELAPGSDPGLDVICNGILDNKPFIYPAELELED